MLVWTNWGTNSRVAGDFRRTGAHAMSLYSTAFCSGLALVELPTSFRVISLALGQSVKWPWRIRANEPHGSPMTHEPQSTSAPRNPSQWRHKTITASQITSNSTVRPTACWGYHHRTKFRITDPLWGESTVCQWTPSQMASNAESVFMSWCHYGIAYFAGYTVLSDSTSNHIPLTNALCSDHRVRFSCKNGVK